MLVWDCVIYNILYMSTTFDPTRPYLVIPKLVEQPTWGGTYIVDMKKWTTNKNLKGKKIGQSYELYGKSKIAISITDSTDPSFMPDVGDADTDASSPDFTYREGVEYLVLEKVLYGQTIPLIKLNQASGNSFQLHIKPAIKSDRWQPKPESWYYLEDGAVTFGIRKGADIEQYKKTCHDINDYMKSLSASINRGEKTVEDARKEAREYIKKADPWQFVNTHRVSKYDLLDLSAGGLHHSWEEDTTLPFGNVIYEIQKDTMDPVSTIRSFDQGKIKDNGSIREIHIDDYFKYLDTDPERNDITNMLKKRQGNTLLKTPYYAMDVHELSKPETIQTGISFAHVFVRDGAVSVSTNTGIVKLTRGYSCFIAREAGEYTISPADGSAVVLKSYTP